MSGAAERPRPHSAAMTRSASRTLLVSIHDVSPRFEGEVDRLLDLLAPHVGERLAMLVVPNHWGDSPIVPGSPFGVGFGAGPTRASRCFCTAIFTATKQATTACPTAFGRG